MSISWIYLWLGVIIVSIVVEIITVGLASIWITGGALVALIAAALGAPYWLQLILFFGITFILLYFTRPWAVKYFNSKKTSTNYEEAIGKEVRVVELVENRQGTGKVIYNGIEWSARSTDDDVTFAPEEMARVEDVQGVKLIISKIS